MEISNLVNYCLKNNGVIKPLLIDPQSTNGTGLMNPSVFIDNGKILCNVRHVNYTLFHSEEKKFHHFWGPLQYIHPENDCTLTTVNYLCELNESLDIIKTHKIDTDMLDVEPLWEFIGLEDVRLFRWENKLYGSGVRRDTTTNGQGRMELSELEMTDNSIKEISRWRIPAPGENNSYCEKNWMPILDLPYHYIKWSNPTEVVRVDPIEKTCITVHISESTIPNLCDFRGGSQVISWNGYYLAIIHEVRLFNSELGRKDGRYYHRFVVWDKNFNIVTFSELFDFLEGDIEFCCGLALHNNNFLVSFGFQDNVAFILSFPESLLYNLVNVPNNNLKNLIPIPVIGTAIVNGVHWLRRLVDSVDYPVDRFIIFNNNGRNQITKELDELANQKHQFIKKIEVCHLPANLGCSTAWNLIIKSSIMAPFWIIVNHDIAFTSGFLSRMMELAADPETGIVHSNYDIKSGTWDVFLIKDFVISRYGLFDENFYPAYVEDIEYSMRIIADGNTLKRVGVNLPYYHGAAINDYVHHGSETWRTEPEIADRIHYFHHLNQNSYMNYKWSDTWREAIPFTHPFNNESLPLTYTTYDINFIRQKYMGF